MNRATYALLLIICLGGCASARVPADALRLPESTLDIRSIQTRTLETTSELNILMAAIAVLQDMEFNIERMEKPLGVITASKVTDADSMAEKTGLVFLDIICTIGGSGSCNALSTAKDEQHITLTMVVLPSLAREGEYAVRITIQRVVYDKENRIRVLDRIDDPEIYQAVFDNLRKSLFIQEGES
jgi:hypothetical protein